MLMQINLSFCAISDVGLCMMMGNLTRLQMMGNLTRLQDAKLVNLINVTVKGYDLALRDCCTRLKKVKLIASVRPHLSAGLLDSWSKWL
nr:hypothetical protein [Tanacetum cinerariifolium]